MTLIAHHLKGPFMFMKKHDVKARGKKIIPIPRAKLV